jgi:hypothetical protein
MVTAITIESRKEKGKEAKGAKKTKGSVTGRAYSIFSLIENMHMSYFLAQFVTLSFLLIFFAECGVG